MRVKWLGAAATENVASGDHIALVDSGLLICNLPRGELIRGVCRLGSLGNFHAHRFELFGKNQLVLVHRDLCSGDSNLQVRMEVAIRRFVKLVDLLDCDAVREEIRGVIAGTHSDERMLEI